MHEKGDKIVDYDMENVYTYHRPTPEQAMKYTQIREAVKAAAEAVLGLCPDSRERDTALQRLEEGVMWANAAVARNEPDLHDMADA